MKAGKTTRLDATRGCVTGIGDEHFFLPDRIKAVWRLYLILILKKLPDTCILLVLRNVMEGKLKLLTVIVKSFFVLLIHS